MTETVKTLLSHEDIRLCAPIALSELKILRPYLLEKNGMNTDGTAFLFAIPYYTTECCRFVARQKTGAAPKGSSRTAGISQITL